MEKRKTLVKALGGVVVGGLLLTAGTAFADDINQSVYKSFAGKGFFMGQAGENGELMMKNKKGFRGGMGGLSQPTLDQLVEEGTISQDKADEIKAFIEARQDLFSDMVKNDILTQEQADTIKVKIKEKAEAQSRQMISDRLKTLVEQGTVTQEQFDKVLKAFEDARKEHEALFEKTGDMTPEERRQFMQDNKDKFQDPLSQLVADGTITEDQAKAIGKWGRHGKGFKGGWR